MKGTIKGLDPLIEPVVTILNDHGFKTFESCQGGEGHCAPEPFVHFEGNEIDLMRAFDVMCMYDLRPLDAYRVYRKEDEYKNDNTPQLEVIGETWTQPFNKLIFLFSYLEDYQNANPGKD